MSQATSPTLESAARRTPSLQRRGAEATGPVPWFGLREEPSPTPASPEDERQSRATQSAWLAPPMLPPAEIPYPSREATLEGTPGTESKCIAKRHACENSKSNRRCDEVLVCWWSPPADRTNLARQHAPTGSIRWSSNVCDAWWQVESPDGHRDSGPSGPETTRRREGQTGSCHRRATLVGRPSCDGPVSPRHREHTAWNGTGPLTDRPHPPWTTRGLSADERLLSGSCDHRYHLVSGVMEASPIRSSTAARVRRLVLREPTGRSTSSLDDLATVRRGGEATCEPSPSHRLVSDARDDETQPDPR